MIFIRFDKYSKATANTKNLSALSVKAKIFYFKNIIDCSKINLFQIYL